MLLYLRQIEMNVGEIDEISRDSMKIYAANIENAE